MECGVDVNHVDNEGVTPLFYTVRSGSVPLIKLLIANGAEINHVDSRGVTPYGLAKMTNSTKELTDLLIKSGAQKTENDTQPVKTPKPKKSSKKPRGQVPAKRPTKRPKTEHQNPLDSVITIDKQQPESPAHEQEMPQETVPSKLKLPIAPKLAAEQYIPHKYNLMVLRDGEYRPLSASELAHFEARHPDIAQFWSHPSALQSLKLPTTNVKAESWDDVAILLMDVLWNFNGAKVFHEPVDPDRLNIPDYLEVVKTPIDFGTIRQRLQNNNYHYPQEFIDDVQLVFENCLMYNGESSTIGKVCNKVREEFKRLYLEFNLEFYLN